MKNKITEQEYEQYRQLFNRLSNTAQFSKAHALAKKFMKKYPDILLFAYHEAVMTAEDTVGFTQKKIDARYALAASKLKKLLSRKRFVPREKRGNLLNEYYWFSKQPLKQYRLGVNEVNKGNLGGHYSQGVGAAMLAKKYAEKGKEHLCLFWAKRSEEAWKKYTHRRPDWFNSYFFYAMAYSFQRKNKKMEDAISKIAKYSGKTESWQAIKNLRKEISDAMKGLDKKSCRL